MLGGHGWQRRHAITILQRAHIGDDIVNLRIGEIWIAARWWHRDARRIEWIRCVAALANKRVEVSVGESSRIHTCNEILSQARHSATIRSMTR